MLQNQFLDLLMLGSSMVMGMVPELHPDVHGVRKKFQMTNFTMTNNMSSMKHALKTVPGLPDVGVPNGDGDGPMELCPEGPDQKSEHTTLISMKN